MKKTPSPRRDFAGLQARRMRAAKMFAAGQRQAEVVRRLGVSRQTASRWHKAWSAEGKDGLRAAGRAGRKPRLDQQARIRLALALLDGPRAWGFATELWTLERVGAVIRKTCGVQYSPSQVWRILGQLNWSRQRPARRAKQREEKAIARWVRYRWPVVKKTPRG
jgi:transposase